MVNLRLLLIVLFVADSSAATCPIKQKQCSICQRTLYGSRLNKPTSEITTDIVARAVPFFPDKFNLVCHGDKVVKKTYAKDARLHHLMNACKNNNKCTVDIKNVHEMASSIMNYKFMIHKHDIVDSFIDLELQSMDTKSGRSDLFFGSNTININTY